jgi:zinc transport system substrate-binding protein
MRTSIRIGLILMILITVNSCKEQATQDKGANSEVKQPLAFVSILPMQYLVDQVSMGLAKTEVMVRPGYSPATYEPLPSQVAALSKANLFFMVGHLGFESAWKDRLAETNPGMKIINLSEGVTFLEGGHVHHDGESFDPHIWVAPDEVRISIGNIEKALSDIDPVNASTYQSNAARLLNRVDSLQAALDKRLEPIRGSNIYIFHPALGYLAKRYDLHQISLEHEGKEPTPAMMRQISISLKKEKNPVILVQQEFDKKHAEVIARETNARIVDIYPLKYDWFEMMDGLSKAITSEKQP